PSCCAKMLPTDKQATTIAATTLTVTIRLFMFLSPSSGLVLEPVVIDFVLAISFHAGVIGCHMFTWLAQETRRASGPPSNTAAYRLPWLGEQFGVFDRDVELQRVSLPGEAFDHVQSITVEIAVSVQPGLRIDGDDIHDERIPVPGRDGMTKRHWIEILTVLHANRNNSEGVGLIFITLIGVHQIYRVGRLNDFRGRTDTRNSRRIAVDARIDAARCVHELSLFLHEFRLIGRSSTCV